MCLIDSIVDRFNIDIRIIKQNIELIITVLKNIGKDKINFILKYIYSHSMNCNKFEYCCHLKLTNTL